MSRNLSRLDRDIPILVERGRKWRAGTGPPRRQILVDARHRRDEVAFRLHTRAEAAARATSMTAAAPVPVAWLRSIRVLRTRVLHYQGPPAAGRTAEAVRRGRSRNALFIRGGLLLCTAAIVVHRGRLGGVTAWAGGPRFSASRRRSRCPRRWLRCGRRLRATAETFAGVGLVLVALDGYAAWYVNLFG